MIVYTRPPYPSYMTRPETAYPYILVNAYDESTLRYVTPQSAPYIRSVLLDSGVHSVFHRLELKEYPGGYQAWIDRVYGMWRRIASLVSESYAVIPDYPSDYDNNPIDDNVERTMRNIEYAVRKYPNAKWVIPIQGKKDDIVSVVRSFEYLRDLGLIERYGYIAVAPTCTTHNIRFLRDVAAVISKRVKKIGARVMIHMFGVTMRAWPYIADFVDSTDTIVGNIWCKPLIGKMCTRKEEKEMAWRLFLSKLSEYGMYTRR
jgi:hypothetical protein